MQHYSIALLNVTDPMKLEEYLKPVTDLVHKHGGRYLCRTSRIEHIEGANRRQVAIIIEWDEKAGADAFYRDPDYLASESARLAAASGDMLLVAGHDVINDG